MIRNPRRTSVRSTSAMTCPGEQEPPHALEAPPAAALWTPTSWSHRLRACAGDCLTPACLCVLQNPVSCLQPQWGLFRLFSCCSEPHLPDGLLGPRHWQQRHEPGSWEAAAVGHKSHEAAGTGPARGSLGAGYAAWTAPCVESALLMFPVFVMSAVSL